MRIEDIAREQWIKDVAAVFGVSNSESIRDLHTILKNLACHYVLEQYLANPEKDEFDINIAPYGMGKLRRHEDGSFSIVDVRIYPSFMSTLINTIKTRESNLYREHYQQAVNRLRNQLETFSESGEI